MKRTVTLVLLAVLAALTANHLWAEPTWDGPVSEYYVDTMAPNRTVVALRQVGTAYDYPDDTVAIQFTDCAGNTQYTRSSAWTSIDLTGYGVPADARVAIVALKRIITKGSNNGDAVVYAFLRRPGAPYGEGPAESPATPVDSCLPGPRTVQPVIQTVLHRSVEGMRDWSVATVPLTNGRLEWAWGYRKIMGQWPNGDALGLAVYLNGWGK